MIWLKPLGIRDVSRFCNCSLGHFQAEMIAIVHLVLIIFGDSRLLKGVLHEIMCFLGQDASLHVHIESLNSYDAAEKSTERQNLKAIPNQNCR